MKVNVRSDVGLVICADEVHVGHVCVDIDTILDYTVSTSQVLHAFEVCRRSILFCFDQLFSVTLLPRRLRRLIATSCVFLGDSVAVERGDFEIDSTELDDVSHSHQLALVIREEILQNLGTYEYLLLLHSQLSQNCQRPIK